MKKMQMFNIEDIHGRENRSDMTFLLQMKDLVQGLITNEFNRI